MAEAVVHDASRKLLEAFLRKPAHAVLLTGEEGVGLGTVAHDLAERMTGNAQVVMTIEPEKGLISIERIRQLYQQTKSIQAGKRCIIIDDADAMSTDAQNALLKLLEEPVENIHFILTSHHEMRLLPTIRSRMQHISLLLVDEKTSRTVLGAFQLDDTQLRQALFLAGGRPAELTRLGSDPEYFQARTTVITDARTFLQADSYLRLTILRRYTERTAALGFLSMCARLLSFSVLKQRNYGLSDAMDVLETVAKRIEANGHVRTQLAYLVTKLP